MRNLKEGNLRQQTNNYGTGGNFDREIANALIDYNVESMGSYCPNKYR
jgi:hypothetical protein